MTGTCANDADIVSARLEVIERRLAAIEKNGELVRDEITRLIEKVLVLEGASAIDEQRIVDLLILTDGLQKRVFPKMDDIIYEIDRIIGVDFSKPVNPLDRRRPKNTPTE